MNNSFKNRFFCNMMQFFMCITMVLLSISCNDPNKKNTESNTITIDSLLTIRYQQLLSYPLDSVAFPRSFNQKTNTIKKVPSKDWTSGFFPGNLWLLYELTKDDAYKEKAIEWTAFVEKEKFNDRTHDMGFKMFCSFGLGLKAMDNIGYEKIIVESAKTLCTRFNENVGSLRSWDFNRDIWEFPVIIDNMMNLELLFEATKISKDSAFHKVAVKHANTTLKNHFRPDNSSYHVVVYDTITGAVKDKVTHQGINDGSSWARGQGWGIYGFTMAYRYTGDPAYLKQAQAAAAYYMQHDKLPEDGVPFWDFNDPDIPNSPRDVSAATIVASACYELYSYTKNDSYLAYANKVLTTLKSKEYILKKEVEAPFILDHSTGNWPKKDEVDEPIVYADYYFLEALTRKKNR